MYHSFRPFLDSDSPGWGRKKENQIMSESKEWDLVVDEKVTN
jgi:hypothetical protein